MIVPWGWWETSTLPRLPKETVNAWHTRTVSGYNWFSCISITWHGLPRQALACTTITCWPIPFWEPARRSGLCFDISMYVARNACQWMKSWLNRPVLDSRMPCSTCWDIPNDCLMVGVNWRARTISCSCVGVTSPWCFMQWPTTLESWETHRHQDATCHWLNKKAEWSKTCKKWSRYCNTKVHVWIRSLGRCTPCVWPRRWTCWTSPSCWLAQRRQLLSLDHSDRNEVHRYQWLPFYPRGQYSWERPSLQPPPL